MADVIDYRFVVKRDLAANFTAANTLLLQGEFGLETDTNMLKMGDGSTPWNSLAYWLPPQLSKALDTAFGNAQGSILYRDAAAWKALAPGASGQVLQSGGESENPSWVTPGGGGGGGGTSINFGAWQSTAQSIAALTPTKIKLDTIEADSTSGVFSTVNSRFTPGVAGWYQFNGAVGLSNPTTASSYISLYKNGVEYKRGVQNGPGASFYSFNVSSKVYLNGSTDYVELWILCSSSAATDVGGSPNIGKFFVYLNGGL